MSSRVCVLLDCGDCFSRGREPGSRSLVRSTSATTRFGCGGIGCMRRQPMTRSQPWWESLRARGIRRTHPFSGRVDADGWPGWRSKAGHVRYVPERAEPS